MEEIKYKEVRRVRGRRSPGDRRVSCVGYAGPERRSGKDRRLATGLVTAMVAGSLLMAAEEASAEIYGRRLTDRLHVRETVLPGRRHSLLNIPATLKNLTPSHLRAVPSTTGESAHEAAPKALRTNYSIIYYNDVDQLYSFSEAVEGKERTVKAAGNEVKLVRGVKGFFGSFAKIFRGEKKAEEEKTPAVIKRPQSMELTAGRVDGLVKRVSTILHLDPPDLHVSIYLYDSYDEVEKAYMGLGHTGKAPRAFYSLKSRAVYLPVEGLTSAIFAHEIAHAVINSSYSEPLPYQLTEVLAHHVRNNL